MLNVIYYPISAILAAGHTCFGLFFGESGSLAWILAIAATVFVFRLCLLPLTWLQFSALRANNEPGTASAAAVFPIVPYLLKIMAHVLMFVGVWHVLRSFNRTGTGYGALGMSSEANAHTANYLFGAADVQDFLVTRLFGVPLSVGLTSPSTESAAFAEYGGTPSSGAVALVVAPLILAVAALTAVNGWSAPARYFTQRRDPYAAVPDALGRWVLPVLAVLLGFVLPVGMLIYLLGNCLATCAEHRVLGRRGRDDAIAAAPDAGAIGRTTDGRPVYPVVGYTADGMPVTADRIAGGASALPRRTNTLAVVALILGLIGGFLAIPFGHIARSQIRRTGEEGAGMALAGLILGYLWVAALVIGAITVVAVVQGSQ